MKRHEALTMDEFDLVVRAASPCHDGGWGVAGEAVDWRPCPHCGGTIVLRSADACPDGRAWWTLECADCGGWDYTDAVVSCGGVDVAYYGPDSGE